MEGIEELHNNIFFYLTIILFTVTWMMISIIKSFLDKKNPISYKYMNHGTLIELIWTITPAIILILIAFPSFKLLYLMDEVLDPSLVVHGEGLGGLILYLINFFNKNLGPRGLTLTKINLISNKYSVRSNSNLRFNNSLGKHLKINTQTQTRSFHSKVKASNRIGPHNTDIISVIIGTLLGDAYGNKRTGEGVRFCYRQSIVHKEYLFWLYTFFFSRGYCSNLEPRKYARKIKGITKEYYGYEFNTFTFRSLGWIYKMFYLKGKKIISPNLINYLTPLALAVWIMDDGGYANPGVRIATYNFSLKEVELLISMLKKLYGLNCTMQVLSNRSQANIYIPKSDVPNLIKIVLPHFHKTMYYKLAPLRTAPRGDGIKN